MFYDLQLEIKVKLEIVYIFTNRYKFQAVPDFSYLETLLNFENNTELL